MRVAIALLLISFCAVALMQHKLPQPRLADSIVFEFNESFPSYSADTLRLMGFGYSRMMSSLLWLRFLQHTPTKKIGPNEVSWIYRDLDAVTEIDPDFYPAYEHGGIFLSVITEDKLGAEQVLLKGTKHFPERWRIRAYLAYHYHIEMNKPELAQAQYQAGARLPGAPPLLAIRAGTMLAQSKGREFGIEFLKNMIAETKDAALRKHFEARLKVLKEMN